MTDINTCKCGGQGCISFSNIPCENEEEDTKSDYITKIPYNTSAKENLEYLWALIIQKEYSNFSDWCSLWTIKCKSKSYRHFKKRLNPVNCPMNKFKKYNLDKSTQLEIYKGKKVGDFTLNDIIRMFFSKLEDFTNKEIFVEKFMLLCKMLQNILIYLKIWILN